MKKTLHIALIAILVLSVSSPLFSQEEQWKELAHHIIHTSANVKPGDVVVVYGGKHNIPLMEMLCIVANNAGGMSNMFLTSDIVDRALYMDVPEKYLGQTQTFFAEWLKHVDVWIGLSAYKDPKTVFQDIPEERFAILSEAQAKIRDVLNRPGLRVVSVGYPTHEQAANYGIDFSTYSEIYWDAVNADYSQISKNGYALKKLLNSAHKIRVTSPEGTHFSFDIGDRPIFVDDGIITEEESNSDVYFDRVVYLPGGSIYWAPVENSANGQVKIEKGRCNYKPMNAISFQFKNGILMNFNAEEGKACFEETLQPYSGPKDMFAYFSIGLNPNLKIIGDYKPADAAGMIYFSIGYNTLYKGTNDTEAHFPFRITNATVEVDGNTVVKEGKLLLK